MFQQQLHKSRTVHQNQHIDLEAIVVWNLGDVSKRLRDRIFEELRALIRKKPSRWIAAIMGSARPHVGSVVSIDDCHGA
jgi:hypothetical protein